MLETRLPHFTWMEAALPTSAQLLLNPLSGWPPLASCVDNVLPAAALEAAGDSIRSWAGYAETPLHSLAALSADVGVGGIYYKDEAPRFGLGSFKALGGPYAVQELLADRVEALGRIRPSARDLESGTHADVTQAVTVTSATDGNHGRAVAWAAGRFGCRAIIYIHETVSPAREQAIASYGATVVRCSGTYDNAVRQCAADAAANDWAVVSDTTWEGYDGPPRLVMAGYGVMVDEALDELARRGVGATHVFVQAGVGALAAAVASATWLRLGDERPRLIVVEPQRADCLFESARQGVLARATGDVDSIMAGLACDEPSPLAWELLRVAADAFMTIPDAAAIEEMQRLANPLGDDPQITAGESAVAGLAGFRAARNDPSMSAALGLGASSHVLVFGTEGATDPDLYERLVGQSPS